MTGGLGFVDAVIAWVDGNDPAHKEKRAKYLPTSQVHKKDVGDFRYAEIGEVNYCVKSILKFAPHVRHIYIITDQQAPPLQGIPSALQSKISVVDHREIFVGFEDCLPTFNSLSIEALLHMVPGLSERFVYFNDDFFLIRPIEPQEWYQGGSSVLHGRWETPPDKTLYKRLRYWFKGILTRVDYKRVQSHGYRRVQSHGAALAGFEKKFFRSYHTPKPLTKMTYESFYAAHPEILRNQLVHRFRHYTQYSPCSLSWHISIARGEALLIKDPSVLELHMGKGSLHSIQKKLAKADVQRMPYLNIQDLSLANAETIAFVKDWLEKRTAL